MASTKWNRLLQMKEVHRLILRNLLHNYGFTKDHLFERIGDDIPTHEKNKALNELEDFGIIEYWDKTIDKKSYRFYGLLFPAIQILEPVCPLAASSE